MPKPTYDTTVARIAGNLLSGRTDLTYEVFVRKSGVCENLVDEEIVAKAVAVARAIVAEVQRTAPTAHSPADIQRAHLETFGK